MRCEAGFYVVKFGTADGGFTGSAEPTIYNFSFMKRLVPEPACSSYCRNLSLSLVNQVNSHKDI